MCGITGFIDFKCTTQIHQLNDMVAAMRHRGPDDQGTEIYPNSNYLVGFGHARLSIIELSILGHQPMPYKHFTIVFNGEIYNFKEIRFELRKLGHNFISGSDTEVILHAYEQWGSGCVDQFIGMFAFAIYDKSKEQIVIFRDRAGVKPLYYYWEDGLFLFGSEIKTFHHHPAFHKEISPESVNLYFKYGFIPSPHSIFNNCNQLKPGHYLTFDLGKRNFKIQKYWDIIDYYQKPMLEIGYNEATNEVEKILTSACNYRMVADVPVGVFLSGGFDSTAVTAILQKDRTEKIKTFTIGLEGGTNEATFAKKTANYLGTDHTEYYCTSAEAKEIIPDLSNFFDEPFADNSAIPTILVSRLAKRDVTVALSADAGDEIFGGYDTYRSLHKNITLLNNIPGFSKSPLSSLLGYITKSPIGNNSLLKHQLSTLSSLLNTDEQFRVSHLFDEMQSYPPHRMKKLLVKRNRSSYNNILSRQFFNDDISVAMAMDYNNYLPNDILTKVDRATMSISLEGREPLLDHRLVEFAARLPVDFKYDGLTTKKILKDIVYRTIPKEMMNRPKSGFSIPINTWLKGDLKSLMEEMLSKTMIESSGFLNSREVTKQMKVFLKTRDDDRTIIWRIFQFQMWYNKWMV